MVFHFPSTFTSFDGENLSTKQPRVCGPATKVGPFEQTMFLGCSIQDVTMSHGWNEQQSTITVKLVEDNCDVPIDAPAKVFYDRPGHKGNTRSKDPGFFYPDIGAPVYFRLGDFEFAGLVQNWERTNSSSDNPSFTVTIADPRLLLENLTMIVSNYADNVESLYNLINPYGYLESLGIACAQQQINGASFGSPAGGFGGAQTNDAGTRYDRLKIATQSLLTGNSHPKFSPYGAVIYRGHDATKGSKGMGIIPSNGFSAPIIADYGGNGHTRSYMVDITDLPDLYNQEFRFPGPSDTLMNFIQTICDLTGCDYYIELIVDASMNTVIKVRTAKRKAQPTLGEIEVFIEAQEDIVSKNVGRELRNETTQTFTYGSPIQTIYEEDAENPVAGTDIIQHWGFDSNGNFINAVYGDIDGYGEQWKVQLDLRPLNLGLKNALPADQVYIYEDEIKAALGSFDTWKSLIFAWDEGNMTPMGQLIAGAYALIFKDEDGPVANNPFANAKNPPEGGQDQGIAKIVKNDLQKLTEAQSEDMKKIHSFVSQFADEHWGKQFLVRLPFVCYYTDADTGKIYYSDNPTADGGWPSTNKGANPRTEVLGLTWKPTAANPELETFRSDDGKVQCFVRYDASGTGVYAEQADDVIVFDNNLYIPATPDEKVYQYNGKAAAVIKISSPVEPKNDDIDKAVKGLFTIEKHGFDPADWNDEKISNLKKKIDGDKQGIRGDYAKAQAPDRLVPSGVALPMKSNTDRYGPWFAQGPPGQVSFREDSSLNPWTHDSYAQMQQAGFTLAEDGATFMQEGEKGTFTMPGYPKKRLGQELNADVEAFNTFNLQQASLVVGGVAIPYYFYDTDSWAGTLGPSITNISANIGVGGVTTTIQCNTFAPTFGKFAKYNANRLARIAKARQAMLRDQRLRDQQNKKFAEHDKQIRALKGSVKALEDAKNVDDAGGQLLAMTQTNANPEWVAAHSEDPVVDASTPSSNTYKNTPPDDSGSFVSWDALYLPISKSGTAPNNSHLARYATKRGETCPSGTGTAMPLAYRSNTRQVNPPILDWTPPAIDIHYLDPYYTYHNAKHSDQPHHTGYGNNNIRRLNHGSGADSPDTFMHNLRTGNYPQDLRAIATRGPLLIQGWGYDLEGKPIPNKSDSVSQAEAGNFVTAGLKDKFLDKWLRQPKTWPVAPLDLRYDRERAVWTVPNSFRIIHARIGTGVIEEGQTGDARISNPRPAYDSDGALISTATGYNIKISNTLAGAGSLESGSNILAYWDSEECAYHPITAGAPSFCVDVLNWHQCVTGDQSGACSDTGIIDLNTVSALSPITGWDLKTPLVAGTGVFAEIYKIPKDGFPESNDIASGTMCQTGTNTGDFMFALRINSDLTLSSSVEPCIPTGLTGADREAFESGLIEVGQCFPYTHLTFGTGFTVSETDCETEFSISTLAGIDVAVCSGEGGSAVQSIEFGFGLEGGAPEEDSDECGVARISVISTAGAITGGECDGVVAEDQLGYQEIRDGEGAKVPSVKYTHIDFGSGLNVYTGETGAECTQSISVHAKPYKVSSDSYCSDALGPGTGSSDCHVFDCLTFGSGLYLGEGSGSSDGCNPTIHADHNVTDKGYCTNTGSNLVSSEFFTELKFGSGLSVTGDGCVFTIDAQHEIASSPCGDDGTGEFSFFDDIVVGTGLKLQLEDCVASIDADFKISDLHPCPPGRDLVTNAVFTDLSFKSGLIVESGGSDCGYEISAERFVRGDDYCGRASSYPNENFFRTIVAGTGLYLKNTGDCNYTFHADHNISAVPYCSGDTVSDKFFRHLKFSTGIVVQSNESACDFEITSPMWIEDSGVCAEGSSSASIFDRLIFRSGLTIDNTGTCGFYIDSDRTISSDPCESDGVEVDKKFFQDLKFTSGIKVSDASGCDFVIGLNVTVEDSGYCNYTPSVNGRNLFRNLAFDKGLKLNAFTEGDCKDFSIEADHYVKDTNLCQDNHTEGSYVFFNRLDFGTGLSLEDKGSCEYRVNANHFITDTTSCNQPTDISDAFFKTLKARSGLRVQDAGDCTYFIDADFKIKKTADCGVPAVAESQFRTLNFSSGIKVDSASNCEFNISAYRKIKKTSTCGEPAVAEAHFNTLNLGSGLNLTAESNCTYRIDANHSIKHSDATCYTETNPKFFKTLEFGSGLTIDEGSNCLFTIDSDRTISHGANCDLASIAGKKFFKDLKFSTGIAVTDLGNCNYEIAAPQYITSTDTTCDDTSTSINKQPFTHLFFGEGIGVTGGDCEYHIFACGSGGSGSGSVHQTRGSGYCGYTPPSTPSDAPIDTCSDTECTTYGSGLRISRGGEGLKTTIVNARRLIDSTQHCNNTRSVDGPVHFDKLTVGTGFILRGTNCEYDIHTERFIRDEAYCGWTPTVSRPADLSLGGTYFRTLVAGTGIRLHQVSADKCEYGISADHYIKSTASYCSPDDDFDYKFFSKLNFGSGMSVIDEGAADAAKLCEFTIHSCTPIKDTAACTPAGAITSCEGVSCVDFRTGLRIGEVSADGTASIDIYMGLANVPSQDGCGDPTSAPTNDQHNHFRNIFARNGVKFTASGSCDYFLDAIPLEYNGKLACGAFTALSAPSVNQDIRTIGAGPGISFVKNATNACVQNIGTYFNVTACSGNFSRPIEDFNFGCGIKATATAGDACGIDIELDPFCAGGTSTGITVVRDVCCTGDKLSINYVTLNFSDCGLFKGITNDGGFCDCANPGCG